MARLKAKRRRSLPRSSFAYPKGKTKGKPGGSYPIDTKARARNALSQAAKSSTKGSYAGVKRKVCARYPGMATCRRGGK